MENFSTRMGVWCLVLLGFVPISVAAQTFNNQVPIPPVIDSDTVELEIGIYQHNFDPNGTDSINTMIETFAFNKMGDSTMTYLGPTIAWQYLHEVNTKVKNNLPNDATVHWHGAHVPVWTDGGPHQQIQSGTTWDINFEILDKSATMWYHPHVMDRTYEQVQMGMSGMIYVEDPVDGQDDPVLTYIHSILPTEYGVNDFPLIFQTKKFMRDATTNDIVIDSSVVTGYRNNYYRMVNGVVNPYLEVPADMIRLRVLNGDGKFAFNFQIQDANGNRAPLVLIATDAGYTTETFVLDSVVMGTGERTEWLVDLRGLEGESYYIWNMSEGMEDGIIGKHNFKGVSAPNTALLELRVGPAQTSSPIIGFPFSLHPSEQPDTTGVLHVTKVFRKDKFTVDGNMKDYYNIDSVLMDMMVVNDTVMLDSSEIWTIDNQTDVAHPFHIHDIHFWVTEIIDTSGSPVDPNTRPEIFGGPLDNVLVMPGEKLSWIGTFEDYGTQVAADSTYMYHCHILPHEDKGMMHQFVVWNGMSTPIGTNEYLLNHGKLKLFPNPAQDHVFLEGESKKPSAIHLIDVHGRRFHKQEIPPFSGTVDIPIAENIARGVIFVEWRVENKRYVRRLILN